METNQLGNPLNMPMPAAEIRQACSPHAQEFLHIETAAEALGMSPDDLRAEVGRKRIGHLGDAQQLQFGWHHIERWLRDHRGLSIRDAQARIAEVLWGDGQFPAPETMALDDDAKAQGQPSKPSHGTDCKASPTRSLPTSPVWNGQRRAEREQGRSRL